MPSKHTESRGRRIVTSLRVSLSYRMRIPHSFQTQANNSAGSGSLLTPRFGFRTADSASHPWALARTLMEEPASVPNSAK